MATKPHKPTATTGSTQPRRRMFTMNNTADSRAMANNRFRAGNSAFTAVYNAPVTVERVE